MVNKYYFGGYVEAMEYVKTYLKSYETLNENEMTISEYKMLESVYNHISDIQNNYVELFDKLKDKQ